MNKLLNKTLVYYIVSAFVLLLLSAPSYYWFSRKLYIDDVDEAIQLRKDDFIKDALNTLTTSDVPTWNRFNRDIRILSDTVSKVRESIIQQEFYDSGAKELEPYRVLYSDVEIEGAPYTLMIRLNLVEWEDLVETTGILYLIILMVLLVGFVLVSKIISSIIWKPFYRTLDLMESFDIASQEPFYFSESRVVEFQQLNKALEKLTRQNLRAFQSQKEFTENAAHELQTPLAVFQSKLDLLLQSPDLTENQAEIVQQLYDAVARLSRLNKNLLLLAKMENQQFADKEDLNLNAMLEEVLPYFSEQAEEKNIQVEAELDETIQVHSNRSLAEVLINNLLLNAIRHNVQDGSISISTKQNHLQITNTGKASALDADGLFKRFGNPSQHANSSGLGLAIIKMIADLNQWEIDYSFSNNLHHFVVKF